MEREANYAAVGAFVVLIVVMAGLFVYWYSDSRDARDYTRYEIYFEGSVSGLQRGASVRYLGVDVGRVASMRIDQRAAPPRVQVLADIDSAAPVSPRTVAELSLQGVTGLLYIDLLDNAGGKKMSAAVPSERYPVIPSVRSNFDLFVSSLPELSARAADILDRIAAVLSDGNVAAISSTLASIEQATASLPRTMRNVDALVVELRGATSEISGLAANLRTLTDEAGPEMRLAMRRVREIADNLASTTAQLDRFLADNRQDVRAFARDGLPELERLLHDSRAAAQEFRELSRSLRENPSQILYRPAEAGVEIPR